jgi:RHH-type proline utilization regulon transcriptional repressor/proline dehydrogenase/delta 1-pyrroline-5-carboxylate dehydrogenase
MVSDGPLTSTETSSWRGAGLGASPLATTPLRQAIAAHHRIEEREWARALAAEAELTADQLAHAQVIAAELASHVREQRRSAGGVDALMHEFSLSSTEGIALMCLAEALLRVPDDATRDRLIQDKIGRGDWSAHIGTSPSLFVNAAAWGLLITGKLVPTHHAGSMTTALRGLVARSGAPLIRRATDLAIRLLGRQFVTGETIAEALDHARAREKRGYRFSYDMLGEAAMTSADADRYLRSYVEAILAIGQASGGRGIEDGPGISIKLSALHPRYVRAQRERVMAELLPRVKSLLLLARTYDIGLNIDAEETDRLDLSLDILEALATDPIFAGWNGIGVVVQAYQRRARKVIDWLVDLGRRSGHRLMVRLVKGAYWDTEIKAAQLAGMADYPVFTRKAHTDISYLACVRAMLAAPDAIFPQFATHNAFTIGAVQALIGAEPRSNATFEFQCLHGMGEPLYDTLVGAGSAGVPCRIYAPVGTHETLLAYLVRRLLENGANTSFVNQVVDPTISLETLIADPVGKARNLDFAPHPALPEPADLFPGRRNSAGLDLASEAVLARLGDDLRTTLADAAPMQATASIASAPTSQSVNPADHREAIGHVIDATEADVAGAVADAAWPGTSVADRAAMLERWADLLEAERDALIALAVREAGKTLRNAAGEVREAVDFCRYYAAAARAELAAAAPIGPVVCISPWNFPLAIFTGQIAAALAAGNPVLAKPAEQTPLIAAAAVTLAHRAGIPRTALQLLPGPGETIGAALASHPAVAGVLFTGSTIVAQAINRTLARRDGDPVLIAETGGLNAMIVDSSALPEQVVADVIESAFDSAGQRCSALRVLCLQDEIADRTLTMLEGAMRELRIGDPAHLATDIGPVIDAGARAMLEAHVAAMRARGFRCLAAPLPAGCAHGTFVAPVIVEIPSLEVLEAEVFGPVLHVIRFRSTDLEGLIQAINAKGYGLTHGLHTRIDDTIATVTSGIEAGNIYVNRNMVGAVVGSQPFGGEGLSGTGPKAGGPFYLHRLVRGTAPALPTPDPTKPFPMPGPTGEANTLRLRPRGRIACLGPDEVAFRAQLAALEGTGNHAVLPATDLGRRISTSRVAAPCRLADDPLPQCDAILVRSADPALRQRVAALPGSIVPVIVADEHGTYPVWRLFKEQSISINTAAAGGNAALLAMGDAA